METILISKGLVAEGMITPLQRSDCCVLSSYVKALPWLK